jgi:hypothetical protein
MIKGGRSFNTRDINQVSVFLGHSSETHKRFNSTTHEGFEGHAPIIICLLAGLPKVITPRDLRFSKRPKQKEIGGFLCM